MLAVLAAALLSAAPAPEPAPQVRRPEPPVWAAVGLGATFLGGRVEPGVQVGRLFAPQLNVGLEGGMALTPRIGLVLYLDLGVGGGGTDVRAYCRTHAMSCSAETVRLGPMVRRAFAAGARTTPWLAAGTGFAYGHVSASPIDGGDAQEVLQYWGWEMLRVQGGVDWRRWETVGVGLYASVSYVLYRRYGDAGSRVALPADSTHALAEVGVRVVLTPGE